MTEAPTLVEELRRRQIGVYRDNGSLIRSDPDPVTSEAATLIETLTRERDRQRDISDRALAGFQRALAERDALREGLQRWFDARKAVTDETPADVRTNPKFGSRLADLASAESALVDLHLRRARSLTREVGTAEEEQ